MDAAQSDALARVLAVYQGSDGDATRALYAELEQFGPRGAPAVNLFRAQKNSERAKVYRGRGYRGAAYDRKQWAMDNLAQALAGDVLAWGWGEDPTQPFHKAVLYVDLPSGQVSFHCATRGAGPDYPGVWDRQVGQSPGRIYRFVADVLAGGRLP